MAHFKVDVPLRWSDMDQYGHVNNAIYATLFEQARVEAIFTAANAENISSFEEGIVVARHETDFLMPVVYGQSVVVDLWVERIGNSSFTFRYDLDADGKTAARAVTVMVLVDAATGRPRRISDNEKEFLSQWRD